MMLDKPRTPQRRNKTKPIVNWAKESDNICGVLLDGNGMIRLNNPMSCMSPRQALVHAAYLMHIADQTLNGEPSQEALGWVAARLLYDKTMKFALGKQPWESGRE